MVDSTKGLPPGLEALALQTQAGQKSKKLGQDEFLKLMTAQLQNQNPLKPMENGQFLSQLAQFGTVNGIQDLQKSVDTLATALQSNQALQASTMVGRSVLVESSSVVLRSGQPASGTVDLPVASGEVTLNISDANGQLVRSIPLGAQQAGQLAFTWDGLDDRGNTLADGRYQLSAEASINDENTALSTLIEARVESVSLSRDGSGATLNLAGLGAVPMDSVREVK